MTSTDYPGTIKYNPPKTEIPPRSHANLRKVRHHVGSSTIWKPRIKRKRSKSARTTETPGGPFRQVRADRRGERRHANTRRIDWGTGRSSFNPLHLFRRTQKFPLTETRYKEERSFAKRTQSGPCPRRSSHSALFRRITGEPKDKAFVLSSS